MPRRILCLHGYTQDGSILRAKMGALRKAFNKQTEFIYLNAPFKAMDENGVQNGFAFWNPKGDILNDIEASLTYIHDFIQSNPPFDGVIGFSQGSSIITLYQFKYKHAFKFAIVISASKSVSALTINKEPCKIKSPCLHICGDNDDICSATTSSAYMTTYYDDISFLKHGGGHGMPLDKESKLNIKAFIESHFTQ